MSIFQAAVLGGLQGITELFPISSLGHTVILPALLGFHVIQSDPAFVSFLVVTHLATALVLFFFFFDDWMRLIGAFFRSLMTRSLADPYARFIWLLILATIPAGLLGLLFQKKLEALFAAPAFAALFLAGNGVMLFGAEYLRKNAAQGEADDARIARMGWGSALVVGAMQCLALFPGFSRTGATLSGGLITGLPHADAARFSFLLATPIIFAAAVLKVPHLVFGGSAEALQNAAAGAAAAALCAYLSVRFLTRYFKANTLTPFAIYCASFGIISLLILG